jgi:gamma-glutamyltranspeptidase / glutathione hydrolase
MNSVNQKLSSSAASAVEVQSLTAPLLSAILLAGLAANDARSAATSPPTNPVRTRHAMVVSVHHLASDAGVEALRQGGNAIDAAVATGFALAVVYPDAGNIGGGGFMLIRFHDGKSTFVDYREEAPQAASADMYLDAHGNVIPDASTLGYRAVAVPGSVAGMVYAEQKYGRLNLKQVIAPAIQLARDGYTLSVGEAAQLHEPHLAKFPDSHRIFQRNGHLYKAGELFKQPQLAATLQRIADDPEDFYHGSLAREISAAIISKGGLITPADLAAYQVKERAPLIGTYTPARANAETYTVIGAPPPSSGGIAMLETFNILEGYGLKPLGDRTPAEMHLIIEAFRRAYMDRGDYLGDPDFTTAPVAELISKAYAAAWRASIDPKKATPSAGLQRPAGFLPAPPTAATPEHHNTTHYSIVDAEGNAVSVTTTINDSFGSGATAEGLGFLLNNEMDDFVSKIGVPNLYGLIQGPANAIAPGKRPLSSMAPAIVLRGTGAAAKLYMVLGTPGGSRIPTTVVNFMLSVVDGGINIQQSVSALRFHMQYLPDQVHLEPGFPPATLAALRAIGYRLDIGKDTWTDGECILIDPATGDLEGGQDKRTRFGKAAGY